MSGLFWPDGATFHDGQDGIARELRTRDDEGCPASLVVLSNEDSRMNR